MTHTSPQLSERILAPDLARGMMLLFIALANVSVYLWGRGSSGMTAHPTGENALDTTLAALAIVFVDGHIYPMFAFLFGYGITQFAQSRLNRGLQPGQVSSMLVRRHLWMLLFGFAHALLLFGGDILGAYALTGLAISALLMRGGDRILRVLAWTLGGVSVGFLLIGSVLLIGLGLLLPDMSMQVPAELDTGVPSASDLMSGVENYVWAMLIRVGMWIASSVGAVLSLVVPFAVLLGGFAARYRWLEAVKVRFSLRSVALGGISFGVLAALPAGLVHLGVIQSGEFASMGFFLIAQLGGIAGGVGYVALFALIGTRPGAGASRMERAVAAVGQRSLSFYLLQSVLFAPLLSAWGFGLGAQLTTSGVYLIAVVVWILSLVLAVWLDARAQRGPAEALLRKLTYGKDDPSRV